MNECFTQNIDEVPLGYNGNNHSKTGTVFVPNVMLTTCTPRVYIPKYTFMVVRPELYGKITLLDL